MMLTQMPLFDDDGVMDPKVMPRRVPKASPGWTLTDHACRHCFGRVLSRFERGEPVESRCAECGQASPGAACGVCCCGADCGALGKALECFRNPSITPENPQEIMVRERIVDPAGT